MDYDTLWSKKTWLWKIAHLQMIFPAINLHLLYIRIFPVRYVSHNQMVIIMDNFDWFGGTTRLSRL